MPRKLIACPFVDCQKSFTHLNNFRYHINWHKGVKPYECKFCPLAFRSDSHLRRHLKTRHFDVYQYEFQEDTKSRPPQKHNRAILNQQQGNPTKKLSKSTQLHPLTVVSIYSRNKSPELKPASPLSFCKSGIKKCYSGKGNQQFKSNIGERCAWKMRMMHLFQIPYNVLNPRYLFDFERDVHRYWCTPSAACPGYIPITELPLPLRVIHDVPTPSVHVKIDNGWEKALLPVSMIKGQNRHGRQSVARSSLLLPTKRVVHSPVKHLSTSNQASQRKPSISTKGIQSQSNQSDTSRKCGYCERHFFDEEAFKVHVAVHKGYGFKLSKCKVCGKRFLDKLKLEAHLMQHKCELSSSTPIFQTHVTKLGDRFRKRKACKYCTFSTKNLQLFNLHFSHHHRR